AASDVIKPYEPDIERLKGEIEKETALAEGSKSGLDETEKAACGPICRNHMEKAKLSRNELQKIEKGVKELRDRRTAALKKIDELKLKLPDLERVAGPPSTTPEGAGGQRNGPPNVRAELAALTKAREDFLTNPSLAIVSSAERSCRTLLDTARELKAAASI